MSDTLLSFTSKICNELKQNNQHRTARAYLSSVKSLVEFNKCGDIELSDICPGIIHGYERHLLDKGLKMNTISFYMRNLRAIYYRAVKTGKLKQNSVNPFSDVFTGVYQTHRRSLNKSELIRLAALEEELKNEILTMDNESDYYNPKSLYHSVLYFLFCYHARGMSFVDLAHLKKTDVQSGYIKYKRRKTGQWLTVKITGPMKEIIKIFKSSSPATSMLFPILPDVVVSHHSYESALRLHNARLKIIAERASISKNLSAHVARHTWATLAKRSGCDISLISECLGHKDISTTAIYLASFETSVLDSVSDKMSGIVHAA